MANPSIFSDIFISRIDILPNTEYFVNQKDFLDPITEECRIAESVIYKVLSLPGDVPAAIFPYVRLMPDSSFCCFLSPDSSLSNLLILKKL